MSGRITIEVLVGGKVIETKSFSGDSIEIGKLSRSDLQLADENISRRHVRIEVDKDGRVELIDLRSTNGTRLNGMRVNKAFLTDGDEVELGVTQLRFKFDAELRTIAASHSTSQRTGLSREGFYRTQERAPKKGRLALEGALLWEDSAIQVDAVRRVKIPVRLKALLLLLFAIGPMELWVAAAAASTFSSELAIGLGAAGLGLFIFFTMDIDSWRQLIAQSVSMFNKGESVYIGETYDCRFFVPSETIGATEYPLLIPHRAGWALNLRHKDMRGDILHGGKVYSIEDARAAGLVKANLLPMAPGTKARMRFGQFSMLLSYVAVPPMPKGAFLATIKLQEMAYMAISLMIHFGLLILFVYLQPESDIQIRRRDNAALARLIQIESIKAQEEEEEEEIEDDLEKTEELEDEIELEDLSLNEGEKFLEEEEPELILQPKPEPERKPLTEEQRVQQRQENQDVARRTSETYIPQQMLAQITGANLLNRPTGSMGLKIIGGAGGPDAGAANSAFAGEVGSDQGGAFAGLNNMGATQGIGGGGPTGATGHLVAGLDKQQRGKGKGRFGNVRFKESTQRAVVTTGRVRVSGGALTKAIIRKYINRQKPSIVLCYKRAVQASPDLEGKVVVSFMIAPTGRVMSPSISSSTLGNSTVEACIVRGLGRWRFPAPQNAGSVRVSYPFLFRTR